MGIIARQSSKKTLVGFIGVLIGAISILFIYPNEKETYGLALFLFSTAHLLMIFMSMGSHGLIVKYFPVFRKRNISGFFSLLSLLMSALILLTLLILLLARNPVYAFLEWADFDVEMIRKYSFYLVGLTIILIFCYLFINQASNFRRIVVPSVLFDLSYKIALPLLVLAVFFGWIDQHNFVNYYLVFFLLVLLGLSFYLHRLGGFRLERINYTRIGIKLRKEMLTYMLFSGLNRIGSTIVSRVDTIMVATLISLYDTGVYGILLFMANVIDIPVRSINQIAAPVISDSMERNDRKDVAAIYKKSSINALVVGLFIFLLIWGILPNIFQIMPDREGIQDYSHVFLFLAIGKLIDMTFSTNTYIIIYSRYFRYNLFFVLLLGLGNLLMNYFFIRDYGLTGAAFASALSLALYNIVKLFFIRAKMQYWPFSIETLKILVIAILLYVVVEFIPDFFVAWPDLFLKGILIAMLYYGAVKLFRVKADVIKQGEQLFIQLIRVTGINKK